jgi:WD40 repeat protein
MIIQTITNVAQRRPNATRITLFIALAMVTTCFATTMNETPPSASIILNNVPILTAAQNLQAAGPVASLIWSTDGTKIAASLLVAAPTNLGIRLPSSPVGNLITIWNGDGQVFQQLRRPEPFFAFYENFTFVSKDKQLVVPPPLTSNAVAFSVLDIATGEIVFEAPGAHLNQGRNVNGAFKMAVSPDQSILAVIFGRAMAQPAAIYSTKTWLKLAELPNGPKDRTETPEALAFSNRGDILAVAMGHFIRIYDLSSNTVAQEVRASDTPGDRVTQLTFSPDGKMIAATLSGLSTYDPIRIYSIDHSRPVSIYQGKIDGAIEGLTWIPNSSTLAFMTGYRQLHLWNTFPPNIGERVLQLTNGPYSQSLAVSPDGRSLIVDVGSTVRRFQIEH